MPVPRSPQLEVGLRKKETKQESVVMVTRWLVKQGILSAIHNGVATALCILNATASTRHQQTIPVEVNSTKTFYLDQRFFATHERRDKTRRKDKYVCNNCLILFSYQEAYDNHLRYCLTHPAQQVECPVDDPFP